MSKKVKKDYEIRITEHVTYWQRGTVIVKASDKRKAEALAMAGKYDHTGDNEILYDTEGPCLEREILSCKPLEDE